MDLVFSLSGGELANFLQHMVQSYGCSYICLWSYDRSTNCLGYKGGFYSERSNQPSSSSGSLAQRLFMGFEQSIIIVDSGHIPGRAFVNNIPYMELQFADLLRMASSETLLHFYREAGIKNAIFMGGNAGEIELGFSDGFSQVNLEMEMRTLFSDDFNRQFPPTSRDLSQLSTAADQNQPASSSSSLRSLSYDSPEYSPLLFDITTTSYLVPENPQSQEAAIVQQLPLGSSQPVPTVAITPHQQAIRALNQIRNIQLPTSESVDAAITRAILAVLTSQASSSAQQPSLPPNAGPVTGSQPSAFRWYRSSSSLGPRIPISPSRVRTQNMLKTSLAFLRSLNSMRPQPIRASATQLHHMISERRRREKLNESFQTLRSLLPPGTKKDKASVLARTTEYLNSLKSQVAELHERNQILEAQLLPTKVTVEGTSAAAAAAGSFYNERVEVQMTNVVAASTSAARFVDLRVTTRSGNVSMVDLVVSLLEFLKRDRNVNLMSVDANTSVAGETTLVHNVVLRLRIEEDDEWDESAFQEAIKRVVDGLPQ